MTRSLLLIAAVVSSSARAQEEPQWSLGAGVGVLLISALAGQGATTGPVSRPVPNASLTFERRLATRTWLTFGVSGAATSDTLRPEVPPQTPYTEQTTALQNVLLAAGVRQNLLSEQAPVQLSVTAILSWGYVRSQVTRTTVAPMPLGDPLVQTVSQTSNGGTVGLGAGIAVERRLIEQLALRLTLGVLQASYSAGRVNSNGFASSNVSGFTFGVALQPGLELRVYF